MNKVLSWALKGSGAVLIIFGLQAWGFYSLLGPRIEIADENLMALLEEVSANSLIDETLSTLRDYRRENDDGVRSRQILGLRQMIVRGIARVIAPKFIAPADHLFRSIWCCHCQI